MHEAFNAALILYAFPARFGTLPSSRGESLKDPASNLTQAVKDLLHDHHATQTQTEKLVALQAVLLMIFADEVNHPREIGKLVALVIPYPKVLPQNRTQKLSSLRKSWMVRSSICSFHFHVPKPSLRPQAWSRPYG